MLTTRTWICYPINCQQTLLHASISLKWHSKLPNPCIFPIILHEIMSTTTGWKGKYRSMDNSKIERNKKKRAILPKKTKRSPDERHTQTQRSLTDTFQQSQMSFSIIKLNISIFPLKHTLIPQRYPKSAK